MNWAPCLHNKVRTSLFSAYEAEFKRVNLVENLSQLYELTADRLAQLVEHRTAVREVAGSNLDRTNTQGL